jgi:hypothetical protein
MSGYGVRENTITGGPAWIDSDRFDIVDKTPQETPMAVGSIPDMAGSNVFQAVQEIGLKLEPRKLPVPVMVVDHVEGPAN